MTSPAGPPEGDVDGAGDAPQQDPSELGEAIRTGRVPIVPGSLVELVMQSGISPDDEEQDDDGSPGTRDPAPPEAPRPAPRAEQPPAEPLEDADLGDLGDDPLGVGPVHAGPLTGPTPVPDDAETTHATAGTTGDTPSDTADAAEADASPATAPGYVVPPPIAPTPAPVPEPATGPNRETAHGATAETAASPADPDDDAEQPSTPQLLFGGPRPLPDGPETDVLPGMAFGRVPGRYPSADPVDPEPDPVTPDPVTSTGRTTMPGRRRPAPGPDAAPAPPPRPTMPGPAGARPGDADPPLSAPPPAHAPGPAAVDDRSGEVNGTAGLRPAGAVRADDEREQVSSTATTGVIPAVTDDGPPATRRAGDGIAPGYEADTRSWSPGHGAGRGPGRTRGDSDLFDRPRQMRPDQDGSDRPAGPGADGEPGPMGTNGVPARPQSPHRRPPDLTETRVVPAVPGAGPAVDPRTTGPQPAGPPPTGPQPTGPQPTGPHPAGPPGTGRNSGRTRGDRPATGSAERRLRDRGHAGAAVRTAARRRGRRRGGRGPGSTRSRPHGRRVRDGPPPRWLRRPRPRTVPRPGRPVTPPRAAEAAAAAEAAPAKKTTPPREAIMSAKPRHGRGVSLGGLAIGLAAILLAALTIWAIVAPSTPDPQSANGAGTPPGRPRRRHSARLGLRPPRAAPTRPCGRRCRSRSVRRTWRSRPAGVSPTWRSRTRPGSS